MGIYSPIPYVVIFAATACALQFLTHFTGYYRTLTIATGGRYASLDGFRGLLAFSVFFHHAMVQYGVYHGHPWETPPSTLYAFLGPSAVSFFFMITGFLFWGKCIRNGARMPVKSLIRSRIRRLMPLYLASVAVMFGWAAFQTGGKPEESVGQISAEVFRWLCGGLLGQPAINGHSTYPVNAAVNWTLMYEWFFYLSLPLTAYLATVRRFVPVALLTMVVLVVMPHNDLDPGILLANFGAGMITAHLVAAVPKIPVMRSGWVSIAICGLVAGACALSPVVSPLVVRVVLGAAFVGVVYGNNVFGVLTSRWATLLGHVSYSIYLLHGYVLFFGLAALNRVHPVAEMQPAAYWAWIGALGLVVVGVALLTYRFIEAPFMHPRENKAAPPVLGAVASAVAP